MSNPTSQAEKAELDVSYPMPFYFSNSYEKGGSLAGTRLLSCVSALQDHFLSKGS
jgi:hypothetical protein